MLILLHYSKKNNIHINMSNDKCYELKNTFSDLNASEKQKTLCIWFENKFKMLESLSKIPMNKKIVDKKEVFELFNPTLINVIHRTFFTNDGGESHSQKIEQVFMDIKEQMSEIIKNSDFSVNLFYYEHLLDLLQQAKKGINNLANHKDYQEDNTKTCTNLSHIVNFSIPLVEIQITEIIKKRKEKNTT